MRCRSVLFPLCCLLFVCPAQGQEPLRVPFTPPEDVAPGLPVPPVEPGTYPLPQVEPETQPLPQVEPERRPLLRHPLTEALNQEMKDIAGAIRALDQSYYIRGYQSKRAWTAGSAFYDWHSRGLTPPANPRVLPPPPVNLSRCEPEAPHCPHCRPAQPACPQCRPEQTPCPDCRNIPGPAGCLQQSCRDCGPALKRGCGQLPIPWQQYSGCKNCGSNPLPSCESCAPAVPAVCPHCNTTVSYRGGRKCVQTFPCPECEHR